MRVLRTTVLASAVVALLATSLAVPAVGADPGKMAIVQGNYGVKVDVCINGREIKSKMRFGTKAYRTFPAGRKVLKVFKADPRTCKGKLLAYKVVKLPRGSDLTVVISKKTPKKVMVFDNAYPPGSYVSGSHRFFRNASDYGEVTFRHEAKPITIDPAPADLAPAEPTWETGRSTYSYLPIGVGGAPMSSTTWISEVPMYFPPLVVAGPVWSLLSDGKRYEWIFIGTAKHPKLMLLKRNW